ncbi:cupin domain-containing protein [Granulicella sp. WH15]|uniref:cupin domain-containing protein n=1 Tax=Granulicella sp. WH15 TaxID=2602070 RepID=UPI001366F59F|nr:cupin domain-containing protein [Granulicella sp. WH15]QHN04212.1 cupin domain-containing protein [Granulicella sp. WH15]
MALPIVDETSIEALDLPGRMLRWVVTAETTNAQHCSMCVIEVQPGQTVKPAHSHPNGEEVIYLLSGSGRVWIEGEIGSVKQGCAILFPQGKIHMLQNTGNEVMKVACFFAPATNLANYRFFEDIEFPE